MARTKRYGQMTSAAAQQISDKIVNSLEEQVMQGSFVPHGRQDIVNTTIGRPEHLGRVRVAGTCVTINQYFGQASRSSSTSPPSITQQQLADIIGDLKDQVRKEVEEENKQQQEAWRREVEVVISYCITSIIPLESVEIKVLGARVSTKGSCTEPETKGVAKEPSDVVVDLMGLYVVHDQSTMLVALGKLYDTSSSTHNVPYANDVVRVSVVTVYHGDAQIPFLMSEVRFVSQAVGIFVAWPKHLFKVVSHEDSQKPLPNSVGSAERGTTMAAVDSLGELVKNLFHVYQKPVELSWDGVKFGIPNSKNGFFITHANVTEIILGDKCLNMSILQLWMMFMNDWSTSIGFSPVYGFLEPHSIHNAKDRRQECEQYIETWVKKSHREVYLGPFLNHAMKKIFTTLEGKADGPAPRWIEPKSHLQAGGYECRYYVMHWMWCIFSGGLKNEWNKWFSDGTTLNNDTMTTLRKKWAAYFLQLQNMEVSVIRIMVLPLTDCVIKKNKNKVDLPTLVLLYSVI
ncbi:hypothetical protein GmHk_07G019525 [Glycine max]|nr:hypothetical protein GmHk_07G019525 [Glycine max]